MRHRTISIVDKVAGWGRQRQRTKRLSAAHEPNSVAIALIVAAGVAIAEIDNPRSTGVAEIRRRRPKPPEGRIGKQGCVNRRTIIFTFHNGV